MAQPSTDNDPLIGRVVGGGFRVVKMIGAGAMGTVYQAEQLSLSKPVAIKLLRGELMSDEKLIKRFELEAKNASSLNHPNSIQIIDFGRDEDVLYIAMELLRGVDLGQVLLREGPLALGRAGRIIDQVLGALDEAHAAGIVHRDLKPANVMIVSRRGEPDFVKVCDFGIAKCQTGRDGPGLTMKGLVCGTPEYMAPEQARGEDVDARADLYAAGVILYQLVTGELPFSAASAVEILSKHIADPVEPPSLRRPQAKIPPALDRLILRALAKAPHERPQSAAEFQLDLRSVMADAVEGWLTPLTPLPVIPLSPLLAARRSPNVSLATTVGMASGSDPSVRQPGGVPAAAAIDRPLAPAAGAVARGAAPPPGRRWLATVGVGVAAALAIVVGLMLLRGNEPPAPAGQRAPERLGSPSGAPSDSPARGTSALPARGAPSPGSSGSGESAVAPAPAGSPARSVGVARPALSDPISDPETPPGAVSVTAVEPGTPLGLDAPAGRQATAGRPRTLGNRKAPARPSAKVAVAPAPVAARPVASPPSAPSEAPREAPVEVAREPREQPAREAPAGREQPTAPAPPAGAGETLREAERLLAQGEVANACKRGEDARRLGPRAPQAAKFLGKCYMRAGDPARAREHYQKYLELAPDAADAAFIKSIVK
jgi:serine/threonine protein kinase